MQLADMLNGDWSRPQLQHFCHKPNCCQDVAEATEKIYSLLLSAWFEPLGVTIPSVTRWHTFGPVLAIQAGGILCHQILGRVLRILEQQLDAEEEVVNTYQSRQSLP